MPCSGGSSPAFALESDAGNGNTLTKGPKFNHLNLLPHPTQARSPMASVRSTPVSLRAAIALALAFGLAACSDKPAPTPAGGQAPAAAAAQVQEAAQAAANQAAQQQAAALATLSVDELRTRARQALREQRIHTPAGDNAMEYNIALRKKSAKPDAGAESALMDLQPYAVIAAEQALTREDFREAERLRGLIAQADPQAPSRPHRRAIARARQPSSTRRAGRDPHRPTRLRRRNRASEGIETPRPPGCRRCAGSSAAPDAVQRPPRSRHPGAAGRTEPKPVVAAPPRQVPHRPRHGLSDWSPSARRSRLTRRRPSAWARRGVVVSSPSTPMQRGQRRIVSAVRVACSNATSRARSAAALPADHRNANGHPHVHLLQVVC